MRATVMQETKQTKKMELMTLEKSKLRLRVQISDGMRPAYQGLKTVVGGLKVV